MSCGWRGGDTPDMGTERESGGQNLGRFQLLTSRLSQVFHEGDWEGAAHKADRERGCNHL